MTEYRNDQNVLSKGPPMPGRPVIVFDVNETLMDLDSLCPTFERIFHDPAAMRLWFADLILYSEALTLAGVYVPFTDIGRAVLQMLAATRDITISDADAAELTDRFATMPPHPEVPAALRRLRDHGFRLFTLTDNTLEISGRQLEHAGVIDVFERRFSVDETVRRHKPAPEAYHLVGDPVSSSGGVGWGQEPGSWPSSARWMVQAVSRASCGVPVGSPVRRTASW
jgi:2-haloacid dehalogenase